MKKDDFYFNKIAKQHDIDTIKQLLNEKKELQSIIDKIKKYIENKLYVDLNNDVVINVENDILKIINGKNK